MESRDVILRPIITEASMNEMDNKRYTFEVEVAKVNIMNVKGKKKRMGRYEGYTRKRRKAIVTLKPESKDIQLFNEE